MYFVLINTVGAASRAARVWNKTGRSRGAVKLLVLFTP
jgi:hypothetical protein